MFLVLLFAGPGALPAAAAEIASLTASRSIMTFGETVELAGGVTGDPGCLAGRPVQLAWQPPDSELWAVVGEGTTAADGTYAFTNGQPHTGRFRVMLPKVEPCVAVMSAAVTVRVRALVDSTLLATSLVAGSCVSVDIVVSPPKPRQTVQLQRRTPDGWVEIEELTLDESSSAGSRPCFGWEDIGVVRLRAVWPAQDAFNETGVGIELAFQISKAPWMERIDETVAGHAVSVSVGDDDVLAYERDEQTPRAPASNEKLLLSMALLDEVGTAYRIPTIASAKEVRNGVVQGNLWLLGRGDPEVGPARLRALATELKTAGVRKVLGRVMGATTYFRHDWWAPGWREGITRDYVALPTALTYRGNVVRGREIRDPERRAAGSLTVQLERVGINVIGKPGAGRPGTGLDELARVASRPLPAILARMNRPSDNFYAEVLGKLLGAKASRVPGTIAKGAAAIEACAASRGVASSLHDGSGLSYENRVTAGGILRLLWTANEESWGAALRQALPAGGQGTLENRLHDVRVRAKTGTLDGVSALSGWVWMEREDRWGEFSILSAGMTKARAVRIEDRIVRIIADRARV